MQACIDHARDLLDSARAVQAAGHSNVAYHLAVLTLEELGRRELIGLQSVTETRPIPPAWVQKHTQDHIKKLFWCFFGAEFFSRTLTKERFESMQDLAQRLHATRLSGLYVEHDGNSLAIPGEAIDVQEASNLIDLAAARLGMAENEKLRDQVPQEEIEIQEWFLATAEDPEKRRVIMSSASLAKLAEFKDAKVWTQWLKQEFERAAAEGRAAAEEELRRSKVLPTKGTKNKWKIRIRILSQSHSIRPKVLTEWNKGVDWIKLSAVAEKKDQLLIDFILMDNVPVEGLWYFAWGLARHFVTALNIGTMGFWWWHMPRDISRYYESIEDLDKKQKLGLERSPSLKMDWGKNRVLSEEDLHRVQTCFVTLPRLDHREQHRPYNFYIGGLTFLSLNDVHWQCENQAFGNFFHSVKAMMEASGDWNRERAFTPVLTGFLSELFPDLEEQDHFHTLFEAYEKEQTGAVTVNLRDAAFMKLFCDSYYIRKVVPAALKARQDAKPVGNGED